MNKKYIVLATLAVLTVITIWGGAHYHRSVQAEKMKKTEQKMDQTKEIEQLVSALFENDKKEKLAAGITEEQISEAATEVTNLSNEAVKEDLLKDVKRAQTFYQAQTQIENVIKNKILADDVTKEQLEEAEKEVKKIESVSLPLYKELKIELDEAAKQYKQLEETRKTVTGLFENLKDGTVKETVTREQYEEAESKVTKVKNKKAQKEIQDLLLLVEKQLVLNEEQEKLLEEERIAEEERLRALEEEEAIQAENEQQEEAAAGSSSTPYENNSTSNQGTWKPSYNPPSDYQNSGNSTTTEDEKTSSESGATEDSEEVPEEEPDTESSDNVPDSEKPTDSDAPNSDEAKNEEADSASKENQ